MEKYRATSSLQSRADTFLWAVVSVLAATDLYHDADDNKGHHARPPVCRTLLSAVMAIGSCDPQVID